jgi:gamma-glutamylcyclotransferase (GGCT)/AIG2-like uncharacterized protein YtfP
VTVHGEDAVAADQHLGDAEDPALPLFVYGSLRDQDVRARVLGRPHLTMCPATLRGWTRTMVPDFAYPFLVPSAPDARVEGELMLELRAADYARLDDYEDTDSGLYVRQRATVETEHGPMEVWVYVQGPVAPSARSR